MRQCVYLSVSVCLSVCPRPHAHTTVQTLMSLGGMVWGAPSCALLGGFAMGAWASLLWQHSAERIVSVSACTRSMPYLFIY